MKTQYTQLSFSAVADFFQRAIAYLTAPGCGYRLVPIPTMVSHRQSSPSYTRTSAGWRVGKLVFVLGICLLTLSSVSAWAGQPTLPSGVPNIFDPDVRGHFEVLGVTNLRGNPDFPMVMLVNTDEDKSEALLLGLDARNGEETWSLESDPIILIIKFSDPTTIQGLYVDTGFADQGKASGKFATVDNQNSLALPDLLKAVIDTSERTAI
ncbi:MAG TPA: hypothetical protein VLM91_28675 [Candidatus Methylomirabilis sp.]|nr:hypothetical protein [Candidatus Methylomirabilis sp.]